MGNVQIYRSNAVGNGISLHPHAQLLVQHKLFSFSLSPLTNQSLWITSTASLLSLLLSQGLLDSLQRLYTFTNDFENLPDIILKVVVVTTDDFEAAEDLDVEDQTPFVSSKRTTMSEDAFADFVMPLPPSGQVLNSSNKSSRSSRK